MTDAGITPAQCRAGREAVQMSQAVLAAEANVSRPVVQDFERGTRVPMTNNLRAIRAALEARGVEFQMVGPHRGGVTFTDPHA